MPPFDHQRMTGPPPSMQKPSAAIDVIGSAARDTRRQQLEFRDSMERDLYAYAVVLLYFVVNLSVENINKCPE